ncbi:MAG: rRNA maturation RNase YbeY [Calditrichaeota bacterium]|nr:rRNA maturation RNase YbeY [Calditrichota bacterium]
MVEIRFDMSEARGDIDDKAARATLEKILTDHNFNDGWLNVVIIGDTLTKNLHGQYLNDPHTTDVLSFEFDINRDIGYMEGEVYANVEQVRRQSEDYQTSPEKELMRVICHGVLHLVGYADGAVEQREIMREKEDYYLKNY